MNKILITVLFILSTVTLPAQIFIMPQTGTDTIYTCKAKFFDSGGPGISGYYSNNENGKLIICPTDSGQFINMMFYNEGFNLAYDFTPPIERMLVYNGMDTTQWLATYEGLLLCPFVVYSLDSANGCITVKFFSDSAVTHLGWQALIFCTDAPYSAAQGSGCWFPLHITLPYSTIFETTDCSGNNGTLGSCPTYVSNTDRTYSYIASGPECLSIALSNIEVQFTGQHVNYSVFYNACPGSGGICIGFNDALMTSNTGGSLSGNVNLPSAGIYYIVIDGDAPGFINYDIDIALCTIGIDEPNSNQLFSLSPNPSNGVFTLQSNTVFGQLIVTNVLGETIYKQEIVSPKTEINLSGQSAGIYWCRVISEDKKILGTRKLVVMH